MDVKAKILNKAHELFVKSGIRSVTMDEIALELGMSKRTIYEQFSDKKTLVEEDAKCFAAMMRGKTDDIINNADNVIHGIMGVLQFVQSMMSVVTPNYFIDMRRYYPDAFDQVSKHREMRKIDLTVKLVKRGIEEGMFRSDLNVDLAAFFINGVVLADHDSLCDIPNLKYGDFERDVLFAYLLGVSTPEGRQLIDEESVKYFSKMNLFGTAVPNYKF